MNYAKIAMLHRMGGVKPILIYASPRVEDAKSLYSFLQSLCNGSGELKLRKKAWKASASSVNKSFTADKTIAVECVG